MHIMKKSILSFINVFAGLLILTYSCERNENEKMHPVSIDVIGGHVQKGPFLNGTSLSIYELNENLNQTGRSFNTQITDNSGTFSIQDIELASQYAELKGDGFYFNEILGETSAAPLTLYALSDLSDREAVNVNVLTHLERRRIQYLVSQGTAFSQAKKQTVKDVLAIFEVSKDDLSESESLDISKDGDGNGILLAVSLILQGYRTTGELSELLANISSDIYQDGTLDNDTLGSLLVNHSSYLNLPAIRENLEEKYTSIGAEASIPDFEKYINQFLSNTEFELGEFIYYPMYSSYGRNILHESVDTIFKGQGYSMAAITPLGVTLKVKLTGCRYAINISPEGPINWTLYSFNKTESSRVFEAIQSGQVCDLHISFDLPKRDSLKIEYYENNSKNPIKIREVFLAGFESLEKYDFPEYGNYGANILFSGRDTFTIDESYSIIAILNRQNTLEVTLTGGAWNINKNSKDSLNWIVSPYDQINRSQIFITAGKRDNCDINLIFTQATEIELKYSDVISGNPEMIRTIYIKDSQ